MTISFFHFAGGENIVDSLRESGISHTAGERSQKPQAALDPARSSVYSISGKRELPGAGEPDAPGASAVHLRREMGLGTAVSIIVGTIIGERNHDAKTTAKRATFCKTCNVQQ